MQASKGRIALMDMLLQTGARVNARDATGSSPLHRSVRHSAGCHTTPWGLTLQVLPHWRSGLVDKTCSLPVIRMLACYQNVSMAALCCALHEPHNTTHVMHGGLVKLQLVESAALYSYQCKTD